MLQRVVRHRFFSRDEMVQDWRDIIALWETRRIAYNILLLATGIAGILVGAGLFLLAVVSVEADGGGGGGQAPALLLPLAFPVPGILLYATAANICYTGGWILELFARWLWGERAEAFGEIAHFLGLSLSILLTAAIPITLGVFIVSFALLWSG